MKQKLALAVPYIVPRLQDVLFISLFFFVYTQGFRMLNGDGDLGRHLTIGNYILTHWVVPTHDIFTHTMAGKPFVPHEWLAEVVFALAARIHGLDGDVLVAAAIIATAFTLVYKQTIRHNASHVVALFVTLWAALASYLHWLVRPHIFTFLFVTIWVLLLEKVVHEEKIHIWLLPTIILIWANTHGGFFLGFLILGAYFAGWAWEYRLGQSTKETGIFLALTAISSFAVSFINPTGWHLWITSTGLISKSFIINHTSEYLSPNFHQVNTWPFLVMVAVILILSWNNNRLRMHELLLLAGWTILSLYMARNIPLYAIITAPYLGVLIQPLLNNSIKLQRMENVLQDMEVKLKGGLYPIISAIIVASLFISGVRLDPAQRGNVYDASVFPVNATNWLRRNPQDGNLFNEFVWGGYLLYRLWPEQTIFIDGTTDFYGDAFTREYAQVVSLQDGWQAILEKYNISWAIISSGSPLTQALRNELGWQIIYQDQTATIIRKPQ